MALGNIQPKDQQSGFWSRQTPRRKQLIVIFGCIVAFIVVTYPFLANGDKQKKAVTSSLDNILTDADTHNLGLGGLSKQVDELSRELATLQKNLKDNEGNRGQPGPQSHEETDTLNKRVAQLEAELKNRPTTTQAPAATGSITSQPNIPGATYPMAANGQLPAGSQGGARGATTVPPAPMRIRTIEEDASEGSTPAGVTTEATKKTVNAAAAKAQAAEEKAYIPSGAILSGVLITGLDAATGRSSTQDPIPVLIRLKHDAILPNRFRADYRECFMIAAGYGDLSSERAYLRAETISCVRNDGKVIDTKIEAYAVGEDGKAGMHGHLVSKQGQAIAKAAVAGFAQAYAQALRPNNSASLVGGAAFGGGAGLQDGAYGGAASALDRVAKFYIDMANQMFPVIEVDAGRPVSLVAVKGVSLALVH